MTPAVAHDDRAGQDAVVSGGVPMRTQAPAP
jgi:hypothetical protein